MQIDNISKVSIMVEIDGKVFIVNLPHEKKLILLQLSTGLAGNEKLNLVPVPGDAQLEEIKLG